MGGRLSGRRVLLSGATGFIGSRVASTLVESGAHVIAVHRGSTREGAGVEWRECDLTDFDEVRRLLVELRPEVVLHLASHVADVAVARIFMVYGPGQRDEKKLVPYVIRSLLNGQAPEVSSGVRPVDWIYVDDVVTGLLRIAESEGVGGRRIDLGSGKMVTVRDVVLEIARLIPGAPEPRFGAIQDRAMEQVRVANLVETRRILGWQPGTELTAGLQATINWHADRLATE
jgi:nucleoside-diphosphate-sugar epimerase